MIFIKRFLLTTTIAAVSFHGHAQAKAIPSISDKNTHLTGYVGERLASVIENRIMPQNTAILVEPFRHLTEGNRWQTEFIGKWMLGAIAAYRYDRNPALLDKITTAAKDLMATQYPDGYMGNYKPSDRLTAWDIWGRKYTSLGLLEYYRLTGDKEALSTVKKLFDCLIKEVSENDVDIASTGLYRGMPSCSILEPTVYLYQLTGNKRYLEFAKEIVNALEKDGNPQLIKNALNGLPVAHRFDYPKKWWSFENGHKAYEMMSCYVGLIELGKAINEPQYLQAAIAAADNIIDTEINIAGSGAAFECWYDGKARQTIPAYHTMETCVTFTWMQLLHRLWQGTHYARYADEFERTMYNALMASLRADGKEISKYSPLEGRRQHGEQQCGLPINCCNANGPRGFGLIPEFATEQVGDTVFINLFVPRSERLSIGERSVELTLDSNLPIDGKTNIKLNFERPTSMVLALRIPAWSNGDYTISSDGKPIDVSPSNNYVYLDLKKKKGTVDLSIDYHIATTVEELNGMQAVVRGPIVFARDSRFNDGDVDECCNIITSENGSIETNFVNPGNEFSWLTIEVPMVLGTDLEDPENRKGRMVKLCDFGSAGNDWDKDGRYRVWLVKTLHVMHQPYHQY